MNPFKVLGLGQNPTGREIIKAAGAALRERRYSGRDIALAQKMLLDPDMFAAMDFIYFPPKLTAEEPQLSILSCFGGES